MHRASCVSLYLMCISCLLLMPTPYAYSSRGIDLFHNSLHASMMSSSSKLSRVALLCFSAMSPRWCATRAGGCMGGLEDGGSVSMQSIYWHGMACMGSDQIRWKTDGEDRNGMHAIIVLTISRVCVYACAAST